ncbi:MAG: hypothetical protein II696_06665 [Firmicutes bacterium]|nr:hypothetical protein [Bacillota bacterium]
MCCEEWDKVSKHKGRLQRRKNRARKNRRQERMAEYTKQVGPCQKDERVVNPGRGSYSKILKKRANRAVRRSKELFQGGQYKKKAEYWRDLI